MSAKRAARGQDKRRAARAAPVLHLSVGDAGADVMMPALTWPNALKRASAGDLSLLVNMLRNFDVPLDDVKARRFVADLIEGRIKITRRGPKRRVDAFAREMIVMWMIAWDGAHPRAAGSAARAREIERLADRFHCSPGRIREIITGRK